MLNSMHLIERSIWRLDYSYWGNAALKTHKRYSEQPSFVRLDYIAQPHA
jgi:hypothetical protein